MLILAQIPLPHTTIDIFVIASVLLAIIGTLFLAYDLLGRENGLLRWFTLVIICGLISALIIGTITTIVSRILNNTINVSLTLQFMSVGGLMGFYTVIPQKGFWNGFVAGYVPWFILIVVENALLQRYSGPGVAFEAMLTLSLFILVAGVLGLATATSGSIAQYTLWRANRLPYRVLGAFGLVLIMVAFVLQGVQPVLDLFNK
jgi:hypothetical protein